jgi:hypothetical protein
MTQQLVFMLGEDRVDSAITRKVEKLRLLLHAR